MDGLGYWSGFIEGKAGAGKLLARYEVLHLSETFQSLKKKGLTMPSNDLYVQIENWCDRNPETDARIGLMRLVLSLYNGRAWCFSIPVCTWHFDKTRDAWAKALILDYFERGESPELKALAEKFAPLVREFAWPPEAS